MGRSRTRASIEARSLKWINAEESQEVEEPLYYSNQDAVTLISHASHSLQSPLHANEDRLVQYSSDSFHCFAAIDGHGGSEAAKFIQNELVRCVTGVLTKARILSPGGTRTSKEVDQDEIKGLLEDVFLLLDKKFCKWARQELENSGACVVALIILDDSHAFVANCGDCRAVLIANETATPLSVDHKSGSPTEERRIRKAGGRVIDERLEGILEPSRAIGDLDLKTKEMKNQLIALPEIQYLRLEIENVLILATDGVWDTLTNDQVAAQVDSLRHHRLPLSDFRHQLARSITEYARTPSNYDDISIVVIECS